MRVVGWCSHAKGDTEIDRPSTLAVEEAGQAGFFKWLDNKVDRASLNTLGQLFFLIYRADHDDACLWIMPHNLFKRRYAVQLRHYDIERDQVGVFRPEAVNIGRVTCFFIPANSESSPARASAIKSDIDICCN